MKVTVDRLRNGTDFTTILTCRPGQVLEHDNGGVSIRVTFADELTGELVQKTLHPKIVVEVPEWTDLLREKPTLSSYGVLGPIN